MKPTIKLYRARIISFFLTAFFLFSLLTVTTAKSRKKPQILSSKKLPARTAIRKQSKRKTKSKKSPKVFHLKDGNKITGFMKGYINGFYQVETTSLGVIKIPEDNVVQITMQGFQPAPRQNNFGTQPTRQYKQDRQFRSSKKYPVSSTSRRKRQTRYSNSNKTLPGITKGNINNLMQRVFSNPDMMNKVMSLSENPQIQSILSNPEIMDSITSGNYQSLLNNPELQNLMNDADVKSVIQSISSGR